MKFKRQTALLLGLGLFASFALPAQEEEVSTDGEVMEEVDGEAVVDDGLAVDDSIEYLENLISLPPQLSLGSESEENPEQASSLFADEAARRAFLGERPRFVYIPSGVDPMIIPWVRERIVVEETVANARRAYETALRTWDKNAGQAALDTLKKLQADFPEGANTAEVNNLARDLSLFLARERPADDTGITPIIPEVRLPQWVVVNTTGVLLDVESPNQSIVLVGDELLQVGDGIARYPAVRVKDVNPQAVTYEFQGKDFLLKIEAY